MRNFFKTYGLIIILAIGITLRFYNLNWDNSYHLHPDERFLTMVGNAMKLPQTFGDYLSPKASTFNPENVGFPFFVYGVLPLTINKIAALFMGNDGYDTFSMQGRFLSALADTLIILFLYKIGLVLERRYKLDWSIKYWSAFFYAISVLPIQLSHFFAVDTFLTLFITASVYFSLRFIETAHIKYFVVSAIMMSLAVASKISAVFALPLILIILFNKPLLSLIDKLRKKPFSQIKKLMHPLIEIIVYGILFLVVFLFAIKIANPYLFQTGNVIDFRPNPTFIQNIASLQNLNNPEVWFPPGVQWWSKAPVTFSLINLAVFGLGIPLFILVVLGVGWTVLKKRTTILIIMLIWIVLFFLYQSTQFVKSMRYFIFLYPFLALFAGIGMNYFTKKSGWVISLIIIAVLIWPLAFFSIYTQKHSRVEASGWIYQNLPNQSYIAGEYWDDPLPLQIPENLGKSFTGDLLPVFEQDTPDKWKKMDDILGKADYYILSSNRGWGSIGSVPDKFPRMSKFYADLFAGKTAFKQIKEITSYPSLRYLGIPLDFPDQWSEEAFTVYDHPQVIIFKKE